MSFVLDISKLSIRIQNCPQSSKVELGAWEEREFAPEGRAFFQEIREKIHYFVNFHFVICCILSFGFALTFTFLEKKRK